MDDALTSKTQRLVTRSHRGKPCVDRLRLPYEVGAIIQVEVVEEAGTRELDVGDVLITPTPTVIPGIYQTRAEMAEAEKKKLALQERVKAAYLRSLTRKTKVKP